MKEPISYQFNAYRQDVMRALCRTKLAGREFRVLLFILGQTDGWHRSQDKIEYSYFTQCTGISLESIRPVVMSLRQKHMIAKKGRYYRVLPPKQWDQDIFVETQKRFQFETFTYEELAAIYNEGVTKWDKIIKVFIKRFESETGNVSNQEHPRFESETFPEAKSASAKEHSSKEHYKEHYSGGGATTGEGENPKKEKKAKALKPKQEEAGMFVRWIGKHENVAITAPNKLVALARAALVATDGSLEDAQAWYVWVKKNDYFWGKKAPPEIAAKIGDLLPVFLRDRKEGNLNGRRRESRQGVAPNRGRDAWQQGKTGPELKQSLPRRLGGESDV